MDDLTPQLMAHHLIRRYGEEALQLAASCVDECIDYNNEIGFNLWTRVLEAIKAHQRGECDATRHQPLKHLWKTDEECEREGQIPRCSCVRTDTARNILRDIRREIRVPIRHCESGKKKGRVGSPALSGSWRRQSRRALKFG